MEKKIRSLSDLVEENEHLENTNSDLRQINENRLVEVSELRQIVYEFRQKVEDETNRSLNSSMQALSSMQIDDPFDEEIALELAFLRKENEQMRPIFSSLKRENENLKQALKNQKVFF